MAGNDAGLRVSQPPLWSWKFFIIVLAVVQCFFCCGLIFGWAGLVLILKGDKVYAYVCDGVVDAAAVERGFMCDAEEEHLNMIVALTLSAQLFCTFVAGAAIDYFGPKTVTFMQLSVFVGCLLCALGNPHAGQAADAFFAGTMLMNVFSVAITPTYFHYTKLFPRYYHVLCAVLSTSVGASSVIFPILHEIWKVGAASRKDLFIGLAVISSLFLPFTLLQPNRKLDDDENIGFSFKRYGLYVIPSKKNSEAAVGVASHSVATAIDNVWPAGKEAPVGVYFVETEQSHYVPHQGNGSNTLLRSHLAGESGVTATHDAQLFEQDHADVGNSGTNEANGENCPVGTPQVLDAFKLGDNTHVCTDSSMEDLGLLKSHGPGEGVVAVELKEPSDWVDGVKDGSFSKSKDLTGADVAVKGGADENNFTVTSSYIPVTRNSFWVHFQGLGGQFVAFAVHPHYLAFMIHIIIWEYMFMFYLSSSYIQIMNFAPDQETAELYTRIFAWLVPSGLIGSVLGAIIATRISVDASFIFQIIVGLTFVICQMIPNIPIQVITFICYTWSQESMFSLLFSVLNKTVPGHLFNTLSGLILTVQGGIALSINPITLLVMNSDNNSFFPVHITFLILGIITIANVVFIRWDHVDMHWPIKAKTVRFSSLRLAKGDSKAEKRLTNLQRNSFL